MHWNRAPPATTDAHNNGLKRYSFILPRNSEHATRPSASPDVADRRQSESGPRPQTQRRDSHSDGNSNDGPVPHSNDDMNGYNASIQADTTHNTKRNRFSMLRFRHASDPQLSATYSRDEPGAPPVPPMPQMPPPPTIITTAPTSTSLDKSARKTKIGFPLTKKKSKEALGFGNTQDSTFSRGPYPHAFAGSSAFNEEPGRLSTSSYRSGPVYRQTDRDTRFSESSRSEQSSGDRGSARSVSSHPKKKFSMLRLKRSRAPLFPLPVKVPPPGSNTATNGRQSPVSNENSRNSIDPVTPDGDRVSPLPSPTQSSVKLSSPKAINPPHLFRKDSTTSAHSNTSNKGRRTRGRSSTLNSLIDAARSEDDPHNSSSNLASGRNSISTTGRKSFGDIFSISNKLRQNSDFSFPRDGRASPRPPGTPGSDSKHVSQNQVSYPERTEDDTPATYLSKLQDAVPKGSIATILSKSDDEFFRVALRKFMRTFAFFGEPIDMAIRKLLMEVELPKETQQIDRVLQSFADRYYECNPGIFASTDQTYFIAFSILILHTDVFNKNNKRKMQKQDYVRNSRVDGISEDILECIYENISYTPFIHVEDELNLSTRQMPKKRGLLKVASSDQLSRVSNQPVDPYAIILEGKLDHLRPTLKDVMNVDDTYAFSGADEPADIEALHQAFLNSSILQIVSARSRPDAFMKSSTIENPVDSHPGLVDIKVVKVGLLWRKDSRKKRARSPWQEWGALLTSSQLYFFRDLSWVKSLMAQYENQNKRGTKLPVVFRPPVVDFKPDTIMSTSDAVTLVDTNYKRHKHAFLFVRHNGLEETFLANSEADMNDWLAKLNYAATFRTTGVPLKATIGTKYEGRRHQKVTRMNSVSSESSQTQSQPQAEAQPAHKDYVDPHLAEEMSVARQQLMAQRIAEADEKLSGSEKQLDDLLRNARHLQLLTPVHNRARENVILAAGRMSAKLKWMRFEIWRTRCYKQFLSLDLSLEEKASSDPNNRASFATAKTSLPSLSRLKSVHSVQSFSTAHQSNDVLSAEAPSAGPAEGSMSPGLFASAMPSEPAPDEHKTAEISSEQAVDRANSSRTKVSERDSSLLSSKSKTEANSLRSPSLKAKTSISNFDDGEERILREAGLLTVDEPAGTGQVSGLAEEAGSNEKLAEEKSENKMGDRNSRNRRSLQRTLRESHGKLGHQRSKKGRDSSSSIPPVDSLTGEGEVLSRKDTNFTLHGKKASVITFGSEWQNIPPEERLKLRKPATSEESKLSETGATGDARESMRSGSVHSMKPQSTRSASTATARSSRYVEGTSLADGIPEVPSLEAVKREQAGPSSGQNKENEAEALAPEATNSDEATKDGPNGRENGEFVDQNSSQDSTRHGPREQTVGA